MKCERWTKISNKPTEGHFISCPARAEAGDGGLSKQGGDSLLMGAVSPLPQLA